MDEAFYPKDNFFFSLLSSARCCSLKLDPEHCETLECSRGRSAKCSKARGGVPSLGKWRHRCDKSEEPCQDDVGGEG